MGKIIRIFSYLPANKHISREIQFTNTVLFRDKKFKSIDVCEFSTTVKMKKEKEVPLFPY